MEKDSDEGGRNVVHIVLEIGMSFTRLAKEHMYV